MSFKVSTELIPNRSVSYKKLADPLPQQLANFILTGSTDGGGTGGANPSDFTSQRLNVRLQDNGTDIFVYAATVWGYNNTAQGGFVAKWAEFRSAVGNTRARFTLAEKQGESGNVLIDSLKNCAQVQTIQFTGTPTGGTQGIIWNGIEFTFNYNDSAATVQTALSGAAGLFGTVTVTGPNLPAGPLTVTYSNTKNTNILTAGTNALTGGSSPAASIAVTSFVNGATYLLSGGADYETGTESARGALEESIYYSGKRQQIITRRQTEHAAYPRRIHKQGRIQLSRSGGGVYSVQWCNLSTAVAPCDDKDMLLYDGGIYAPAWLIGFAYQVNDLVTVSGVIYKCIQANTGNTPPNPTYWSTDIYPLNEAGSYNSPIPPGTPNIQYALPYLTHNATGNGSDRVTVDFSQNSIFPYPGKPVSFLATIWNYLGVDPQNYMFVVKNPAIGLKNGLANAYCMDIDLSKIDFVQAAAAGNNGYQRDNPAHPAALANGDTVFIDVSGYTWPFVENLSTP